MGFRDFISSKQPGITVDEALLALSKGSVLIDVRTENEYLAGHAPGARPIDPKDLADDPLEAIHGDDPLAERDAPIIITCDNGLRSGVLAAELRKRGLLAESIKGGLVAWQREGNPIIPGPYRRRR